MEFDLRDAINALDQTSIFELANLARPANSYIFNTILPNQNMETYDIDTSSMTIRTTMAGLTGMDSNYTPGGAIEMEQGAGKTGKMSITNRLPEKLLRDFQSMLTRMQAQGVDNTTVIQQTGLNFVDKLIVQAMLDREEWLKGLALFTGAIDWTFNGKRLLANYGVPAENFLTARTGNNGYGGSTSKFWEDVYDAYDILNWRVSAIIANPTTVKTIMANAEVNQLEFVTADPSAGVFSFRRLVTRGGNTVLSSDPRDVFTIIAYNQEGEIWDLANPGETIKVPFAPVGKILFVGEAVTDSKFIIGDGGTQPPAINNPVRLGYGHVAPTTEGGGRPGRWARLYTPEGAPWSLAADGAENFLPVIQAPKRLVVATTEIP